MTRNPSEILASLIPEHLERRGWSRERIAAHQQVALRETLAHAIAHSPFHARRLRGVDPQRFEVQDLSGLPTMTKDEMMGSFDDVVCDRRLTLAGVEKHLADTGEEPRLLLDDYLVLASGGSSGVRGIFLFELKEAAEYLLSGVRTSIARMLGQGGPPAEGLKVTLVAASSGVHATRALARLFGGGGLLQAFSIPATIPLPEIVRRLESVQPASLQGYPSIIAQLADEKAAGRLAIAPVTLTTSSEPLTEDLRARITAGFGLPVIDQFGSSEGLMGSSEPGDGAIAMPGDLAILELVDDDNRPVEAGVESSKVLLTTLYNRTQPLVRYELTDRMTRCADAAGDGHLRVAVSGRSDDLLRYGGVLVHPHAIRSVMVNTASVREYQIRQTARGVDVDVVASPDAAVDETGLGARLAKALAAAGLADAEARVRVVADLPRHPQSGKVRRIVPLA